MTRHKMQFRVTTSRSVQFRRSLRVLSLSLLGLSVLTSACGDGEKPAGSEAKAGNGIDDPALKDAAIGGALASITGEELMDHTRALSDDLSDLDSSA